MIRKKSSHVSPRMCAESAKFDAEDVDAVERERGVEEDRRAVADRSDDADQADDVEPAGHPAPALAAQVVGPPVRAAGRRVARGQLGHREGHHQDEKAEHRPADRNRDRAAVLPRECERRERPGEDGNDRERDREVRETRPRAGELLPVARDQRAAARRSSRRECRRVRGRAGPRESSSTSSSGFNQFGRQEWPDGWGHESRAPYGPRRIAVNDRESRPSSRDLRRCDQEKIANAIAIATMSSVPVAPNLKSRSPTSLSRST